MQARLLRQIRMLQACVVVLFVTTAGLYTNSLLAFRPDTVNGPKASFKVIDAERINIRERDGTLKAALSNAAGFSEGQRAAGAKFSGLMFYNEEGQETGGLTFRGKAIPGGQDADVTLAFDQYRQDQNVYLHHEEYKDAQKFRIEDGLSVNARPDWTGVREEFSLYDRMAKLLPEERERLQLSSAQGGKIATNRLFLGVQRGSLDGKAYDNTGLFIKNKWGRTAIRIYVDDNNQPHFEIFDELGRTVVYSLKLPRS